MSARTRLIFEGENRTQRAFSQIDRNITGLSRRFGTLAGSARSFVGILTGGFLVRAGAQTVAFADDIQKLAIRLDTTTEEVSRLAFAADRAGINFQTFQTGVRGLSSATEDAIRGTGEYAEAFRRLFINAEVFSQLPLTQQLQVLADQFERLQGTERQDIAATLFGGRAQAFLQLLADGSEGIAQLGREADQFGATIGQGTADSAAAAVDSFANLSASFRNLTLALADTGILDGLTNLFNAIANAAGRDAPEAISTSNRTLQSFNSTAEEAVTLTGQLKENLETIPENVVGVPPPGINPTLEIVPSEEELRPQFSQLQSTLAQSITAGAEEGGQGVEAVFSRTLQNLAADLAASAFLQLLRNLVPGLGALGGEGAGGILGRFFGFNAGTDRVPGPTGAATLAVVHGGETIIPSSGAARGAAGGMQINVDARGAGPNVGAIVTQAVKEGVALSTRNILDLERRGRFR